MDDGLERARERRNILEQLGAKIPGFRGYLERELRREVDKLQRDWLANEVEKGLDRLANRIRHADYGSSGFFDAVKIGEAELDRLYAFDLALTETVEYLALQVEQLPETADDQMLGRLLDATRGADRKFDERATVFEEVTQKGGV